MGAVAAHKKNMSRISPTLQSTVEQNRRRNGQFGHGAYSESTTVVLTSDKAVKDRIRLEALRDFVDTEGRMPMSRRLDERELYRWIRGHQKSAEPSEVADEIEEISKSTSINYRKLRELEQFVAKNARMPHWTTQEEADLAQWAKANSGERSRDAALKAAIDGLRGSVPEDISPEPTVVDAGADTRQKKLRELKEFVAENGRMPSAKFPEEKPLLTWAYKSSGDRAAIDPDVASRIMEIREAHSPWEINFRQASEFVKDHGRRPLIKEDRLLYGWILRQEEAIGNGGLTDSQKERYLPLSEVVAEIPDLRHVKDDAEWDARYEKFSSWVRERGSIPRVRSSEPEERIMANWLNRQRERYRKQQFRRDEESRLQQFPGALRGWNPDKPSQKMAGVEAFVEQNGRLPGHRSDAPEDELVLARHLVSVRFNHRRGNVSSAIFVQAAAIPGVEKYLSVPARSRSSDEQYALAKSGFNFVAKRGKLPTSSSLDPDEYNLSLHLQHLRKEYRDGDLDDDLVAQLMTSPEMAAYLSAPVRR